MSKEQDAYELIKKAEEKQNPGFFSKIFSSKNSRLEESLDYLEKAANIFKLLKKWEEAGNTYEKCGNIQLQLQNDPTNFLIESAHCFSFVDNKKSLTIKKKIVENYSQNGRFMNAGKYQQQIAEKYEELFDYPNAIKEYKLAADYFSMETMNAKSYEQNCLLKYCDLMCSIENNKSCYPEASDIYEKIAFYYLNIPLLKPSAKDLFFKCVCVHFAYGELSNAISKYKIFLSEDPTMKETREDELLKSIMSSMEEKKLSSFKDAVSKYKKFTDLDKWKINVFKTIHDRLDVQDNPDDFLGD